jgi:hypothetical protein
MFDLKAVVHIGTEKTGTTSIQRYLYLNRKELKSAGFHFIQSAGKLNNWMLPAFCSADAKFNEFFRAEGIKTSEEKTNFKQKFIQEFEKEIQSAPANTHTFIISSEHFHSRIRSEEEMDSVYTLLSSYFDDIKIVCYLREQATTCTSYYSTHLKSAGTDSLAVFFQRCQPGNYYFNYHQVLANWERCFGLKSLDVSLFAQDQFFNSDLLDDFTAKLDPALVGTLKKNIQFENESLKPAGQALARAVNILFPIRSGEDEDSGIRERCRKIIAQRLTGKGQQPGLAIQKSIYNGFIESNEQVRQKFFPTVERLFAPPQEALSPVNIVEEADVEVVASILSMISKSTKETIFPDDHTQVCNTVFSCLGDVTTPIDDTKEAGIDIRLSEADARLLQYAALRMEARNLHAAYRLMTLANEAGPGLPGIKAKLKQYSQSADKAPKLHYMITFHSVEESLGQDDLQHTNKRFEEWTASLDIPAGIRMNFVKDTSTIYTDGKIESSSRAALQAFIIFQAESLEQAVALGKSCPYLEMGGYIEVSMVVYE